MASPWKGIGWGIPPRSCWTTSERTSCHWKPWTPKMWSLGRCWDDGAMIVSSLVMITAYMAQLTVLGAVYWTKLAAQKTGRVFPLISSQEQMTQLWELLKSDPSAVEQFLLTVLQPGVGTVDMSDHQLSATGQEGSKKGWK